jgi:hypothetical protein
VVEGLIEMDLKKWVVPLAKCNHHHFPCLIFNQQWVQLYML